MNKSVTIVESQSSHFVSCMLYRGQTQRTDRYEVSKDGAAG